MLSGTGLSGSDKVDRVSNLLDISREAEVSNKDVEKFGICTIPRTKFNRHYIFCHNCTKGHQISQWKKVVHCVYVTIEFTCMIVKLLPGQQSICVPYRSYIRLKAHEFCDKNILNIPTFTPGGKEGTT